MAESMPAVFFGHGNPLNALQRNSWTEGWADFGRTIQRPRAVLCISAHWYVPATLVTAMSSPRTIHDFGGFPQELYQVQYRAPGDSQLARRTRRKDEAVTFPVQGIDGGSISMLTVRVG